MAITPIKTLVANAKSEIKTLSLEEAEKMVADNTAMFVDIRDPRELEREGRISDAFHAPRGMLEFWIDPESPYHKSELSTEKTLIFFCASAWRSALSVKTLLDMGVSNIAELDGGFGAWKASGRPILTS